METQKGTRLAGREKDFRLALSGAVLGLRLFLCLTWSWVPWRFMKLFLDSSVCNPNPKVPGSYSCPKHPKHSPLQEPHNVAAVLFHEGLSLIDGTIWCSPVPLGMALWGLHMPCAQALLYQLSLALKDAADGASPWP